jgi:phosphate transport system substrate-binding protein
MSPRLSRPTAWARRASAVAVAALVALIAGTAAPAYADYAQIEGDGSTWSQVIFNQWIADVTASGIQVVYNGGGSSVGRSNFAGTMDDFAISEIPYQGTDERGNLDGSPNRPYAYLPIVAGGTAFTYHVEVGGVLMRDVRLSGETIAKIFTNAITNWSDPAIKADNNGRTFPDLPIVPVVRSDGSGTTAQFTTWLDKQYSALWTAYRGKAGLTSYYPTTDTKHSPTKMQSAPGSDQVMNTISSGAGNGTIGYVEYSYALNKDYPVVKVLNAAGYYVEPTDFNVAVALTKAQINQDASSPLYLTQILDGVYTNPDPRAYPLSSYSYMIIPTGANDARMTTAKRQSLADLMFHGLCEGQNEAGPYGYSPLPLNLVQAGFDQLAKLKAADPAVDIQGRDVTKCNNPTFVAGNLTANHLADTAPQPAACDKTGAGPCLPAGAPGAASIGGGTSGAGSAAAGSAAAAGSGAAAAGAGTAAGAAAAAGGAAAVAVIDPETGQVTGSNGAAGGSTLATSAVATRIASRPAGGGALFGGLAAVELVGIILVPGVLAGLARRRRVGA